jgi:chemotaxis protein methyltransferase CheR/two-component system CheB/CheR fusion protein
MTILRASEVLYVVGIGASAGGLEALLGMLSKVRATGYVTYIISQHMARDAHSTLMVELLNRVSPLAVTLAKLDEQLLPDHVYLIPAGCDGVVRNGRLSLQMPKQGVLSTPSVDILFSTIADSCKGRGVGVILSGTGSDGTLGCRAIKAKGGITFAQDPKAAVYDGMPSSAIDAGVIDHIFHESDLPREVMARLPGLSSIVVASGTASSEAFPTHDAQALNKILPLIKQATGTDFSGYKEETLLRRLKKRREALKMASLEDYLAHLQQHPNELANLQHAFLVSLSSFFRDHESFQVLEQALHHLVDRKQPGEHIRLWVAGCASGEEVYTLAIMLSEMLGTRLQDYAISILGTDLNPDAVTIAQFGCYNLSAFKEMPPILRERYFYPNGEHWQVKPELQAFCQFECCDLLQHAPMEDLDLISCRNLLIYLKASTQERLLRKFHQCLVPQGLLFLGSSESSSISGTMLFTPVDNFYRLFERH